jgi:hypothetical protein
MGLIELWTIPAEPPPAAVDSARAAPPPSGVSAPTRRRPCREVVVGITGHSISPWESGYVAESRFPMAAGPVGAESAQDSRATVRLPVGGAFTRRDLGELPLTFEAPRSPFAWRPGQPRLPGWIDVVVSVRAAPEPAALFITIPRHTPRTPQYRGFTYPVRPECLPAPRPRARPGERESRSRRW